MKKLLTKNYRNIIIACLIILILSCNKATNDPEYNYTITIEDVSCIEAWLKISGEMNNTLMLVRDDSIRIKFVLGSKDTVIMDEGLLPGKEYVYKLYEDRENPKLKDTRTIRTLDTTSHNFTWQTWTFGDFGSALYDVAIINENDIWAVGEIYKQGEPIAYNAVHWDGSTWELKRIYFNTICGGQSLSPYAAGSIFNLGDGKIWITSTGDKICVLQNGEQVNRFCLPSFLNMSINKIWGSSSNDIYVVGDGGNIAHFNGTSWSKIESGTTTSINDIWGYKTNPSGEQLELCTVSEKMGWGDIKILKILPGNKLDSIKVNESPKPYTIWTKNGRKIYIGGSGVWTKTGERREEIVELGDTYTNSIRGTDYNDIILCGDFCIVSHYNGTSLRTYAELYNGTGIYDAISKRDNTVAMVGDDGVKAIITIGKR